MRNNNYLSLINFKVKTSSSGTFLKMNIMLDVQICFGYCKHSVKWGV